MEPRGNNANLRGPRRKKVSGDGKAHTNNKVGEEVSEEDREEVGEESREEVGEESREEVGEEEHEEGPEEADQESRKAVFKEDREESRAHTTNPRNLDRCDRADRKG
ncbi:MAG: hypothetical protein RIR10_2189 [Planctomycetota bacterium]